MDLILRAEAFARDVHARQTRKGEAAEPYITHLEDVAALLTSAAAAVETIAAGWLHDTIEDRHGHGYPVTLHDLAGRFGWPVAAIIAEVIDENTLAARAEAMLAGYVAAVRQSPLRVIVRDRRPAGWDPTSR